MFPALTAGVQRRPQLAEHTKTQGITVVALRVSADVLSNITTRNRGDHYSDDEIKGMT